MMQATRTPMRAAAAAIVSVANRQQTFALATLGFGVGGSALGEDERVGIGQPGGVVALFYPLDQHFSSSLLRLISIGYG
jgi:hypothetical protein